VSEEKKTTRFFLKGGKKQVHNHLVVRIDLFKDNAAPLKMFMRHFLMPEYLEQAFGVERCEPKLLILRVIMKISMARRSKQSENTRARTFIYKKIPGSIWLFL